MMSRKRSSLLTPHDVATLPPTLRRRLGLTNPPLTTLPPGTPRDDTDDSDLADVTTTHNNNNDPNRSSTCIPLSSCRELRRLIHDSYTALTAIQRQLYRGEAHYFEESCSHRGNVFQGWDNVWIESGCISDGSGANNHLQSIGGMGVGVESVNHPDSTTTTSSSSSSVKQRKNMPPDYRWFSSSCGLKLPIFVGDGSISALDRPSLSVVGREHDDDETMMMNCTSTSEGKVVNEKEKLEVVNGDDGKVEENCLVE